MTRTITHNFLHDICEYAACYLQKSHALVCSLGIASTIIHQEAANANTTPKKSQHPNLTMIANDILIHIGYQKTGTTWLQKELFNNSTLGFIHPFERHDVMQHFIRPHSLDFDVHSCCNYVHRTLDTVAEKDGFTVLSHERLSGTPFFGGHDSVELANRLRSVFRQPKILIVIREQTQMIRSTYAQYVKKGGTLSLQRYIAIGKKTRHLREFELLRFQYHRLISHYQRKFGADNVLVICYEQIVPNPRLYIQQILEFCGLPLSKEAIQMLPFGSPLNTSMSQSSVQLLARLNHVISRRSAINPSPMVELSGLKYGRSVLGTMRTLDQLVPHRLKVASMYRTMKNIEEQIGDLYVASNQETTKLIGIDLAKYGYQV
ncbi:MAG: sulfotransferase domain-containing protein [Candidatus Promineifilaceae bacterium]